MDGSYPYLDCFDCWSTCSVKQYTFLQILRQASEPLTSIGNERAQVWEKRSQVLKISHQSSSKFTPVPTGTQSDARPSSWTSRTVHPFNSWNTVIMPQSGDLAAVSFLFLFILSNLLLVRGDPVRSTSVSSWKPQRSTHFKKTSQHLKF